MAQTKHLKFNHRFKFLADDQSTNALLETSGHLSVRDMDGGWVEWDTYADFLKDEVGIPAPTTVDTVLEALSDALGRMVHGDTGVDLTPLSQPPATPAPTPIPAKTPKPPKTPKPKSSIVITGQTGVMEVTSEILGPPIIDSFLPADPPPTTPSVTVELVEDRFPIDSQRATDILEDVVNTDNDAHLAAHSEPVPVPQDKPMTTTKKSATKPATKKVATKKPTPAPAPAKPKTTSKTTTKAVKTVPSKSTAKAVTKAAKAVTKAITKAVTKAVAASQSKSRPPAPAKPPTAPKPPVPPPAPKATKNGSFILPPLKSSRGLTKPATICVCGCGETTKTGGAFQTGHNTRVQGYVARVLGGSLSIKDLPPITREYLKSKGFAPTS